MVRRAKALFVDVLEEWACHLGSFGQSGGMRMW